LLSFAGKSPRIASKLTSIEGRYFGLSSRRAFEAGITSIITLLHVAVVAALFCAARLHPVYALCSAAVFVAGWFVQMSFWWTCYAHGAYVLFSCPQHFNIRSYYVAHGAFDIAITLLYLAYLVLAAMAIRRWRHQRQQRRGARDSSSIVFDETELPTASKK
jgi:hypothetical protein